MTTLTLVPAARTCPAWCADHVTEADVCLGQDVTVDIDGPAWMAESLSVGIAASSDGLTIQLAVNHIGPNEVPVEAAREFAYAILDQVRQAETGGAR